MFACFKTSILVAFPSTKLMSSLLNVSSLFFSSSITVRNLGVGGASSRSFITLEQYKTFLNEVSSGDYVIIAFGHNDEKKIDEKFTTLVNNGSNVEGTFQYYVYQSAVWKNI